MTDVYVSYEIETPWKILGLIGAISVADALAAVKKFVFEERRLTMPELIHILEKNWEGKEDGRIMSLNEATKFGNDEDYVDLIVRACGYSAYFVDLSKGLQDEMIKRTEQSLQKIENISHF